MSKMGFSVLDALNKETKSQLHETPQARFTTKDISVKKMYPNSMNFYEVEQIQELAADILISGLKQNLEVVYAPCDQGEYRIVTGERRWRALNHLVDQGYSDFEIATCKVIEPKSEDEEQIEVILANTYRTKSVTDLLEEEKRLKESLERLKAAGKQIKGYDLQNGRLRDVIASILNTSNTKVAQIETVNKNLILEWQQLLKEGNLIFSAAYELAGMTIDDQRNLLIRYMENGNITYKEIKEEKAAIIKKKEETIIPGQISMQDESVSYSSTDPVQVEEEDEEWKDEDWSDGTNDWWFDKKKSSCEHNQKESTKKEEIKEKNNDFDENKKEKTFDKQKEKMTIHVNAREFGEIKLEYKRFLIVSRSQSFEINDFVKVKDVYSSNREIVVRITSIDNRMPEQILNKEYYIVSIEKI